MSGRKKKGILPGIFIFMIVGSLCLIFMANSWVTYEIEETKKMGVPEATNQPQKNPRGNMLAKDRAGYTRSALQSEASSPEVNPYKKTKKRKKIIYEIPLDDVNLVQ